MVGRLQAHLEEGLVAPIFGMLVQVNASVPDAGQAIQNFKTHAGSLCAEHERSVVGRAVAKPRRYQPGKYFSYLSPDLTDQTRVAFPNAVDPDDPVDNVFQALVTQVRLGEWDRIVRSFHQVVDIPNVVGMIVNHGPAGVRVRGGVVQFLWQQVIFGVHLLDLVDMRAGASCDSSVDLVKERLSGLYLPDSTEGLSQVASVQADAFENSLPGYLVLPVPAVKGEGLVLESLLIR